MFRIWLFWWCVFRWRCVCTNRWQKAIVALFFIKWIIIVLTLEHLWLVHWYSPSHVIFTTSRNSPVRVLKTILKIAWADSFRDWKTLIFRHEIINLICPKQETFFVFIDWVGANWKFDAIGISYLIHISWTTLALSFCVVENYTHLLFSISISDSLCSCPYGGVVFYEWVLIFNRLRIVCCQAFFEVVMVENHDEHTREEVPHEPSQNRRHHRPEMSESWVIESIPHSARQVCATKDAQNDP